MPDYLLREARQAIHDVMVRTGLTRTEVINRAVIAYGKSAATGAEAKGEPRPARPDPGVAENGKRPCNEPLYDFEGRAIVGYCERMVKRGHTHRGRHRIEWDTSTRR